MSHPGPVGHEYGESCETAGHGLSWSAGSFRETRRQCRACPGVMGDLKARVRSRVGQPGRRQAYETPAIRTASRCGHLPMGCQRAAGPRSATSRVGH
jgi:hypothetical protein